MSNVISFWRQNFTLPQVLFYGASGIAILFTLYSLFVRLLPSCNLARMDIPSELAGSASKAFIVAAACFLLPLLLSKAQDSLMYLYFFTLPIGVIAVLAGDYFAFSAAFNSRRRMR